MQDFILNRDKYSKCGNLGRMYFLKNFTKKQYIDATENICLELSNKK